MSSLLTGPFDFGKAVKVDYSAKTILGGVTNCSVLLHFVTFFLIFQILIGRWWAALLLALLAVGAEIAAGIFL